MREIKFRAWDRKAKLMWEVEELSWCDPCFIVAEPGLEHMDIQDRDFLTKRVPMDIELMQFTGLKDKNGKEIYEGDIFKILLEPEEINAVTFESGCWMLSEHGLDLIDWYGNGVVIGNIYENPELLEKK